MSKTNFVSVGKSEKSIAFTLIILIFISMLLVTALLFRSPSPVGAAPSQQLNPVQWEYLTLTIDGLMMGPFGAIMDGFPGDSEDLGGGVRVLQNGVQSVVDKLNSLGEEGWELVGFTHNYGERGGIFVFKRPVS